VILRAGTNEMENLVFTQLSITEIRELFREELANFFAKNTIGENKTDSDEIGGIDLAIELTGLAKPTIYSLCSERKIPHSKRGKRLYFSRRELIEWIQNGKRKTQNEIAIESENFGQKNMEAIQPIKTRNRFPKG
jgi:predicted DNA-binding transcriptional regulator AlpA